MDPRIGGPRLERDWWQYRTSAHARDLWYESLGVRREFCCCPLATLANSFRRFRQLERFRGLKRDARHN